MGALPPARVRDGSVRLRSALHVTAPTGSPPDSCYACGSSEVAGTLPTPAGAYRICAQCGTAALPDDLDVEAYYANYFPSAIREDSPLLAHRYRDTLRHLAARTPGRRILEVGCGNAQLLAVAREEGWKVTGTELSATQAEHGRRRGLDVVQGDLATEPGLVGGEFDAAVLIEVVEHLPVPLDMLAVVAKKLAPGGVLYATTPNFSALSRRVAGGAWSVLNREHRTVFTPAGIRRVLELAGLRPVDVRSRNLNPVELVHHLRERVISGRRDGHVPSSMVSADRTRSAMKVQDRIESSRVLRALKGGMNRLLGATDLGDTLVIQARKDG